MAGGPTSSTFLTSPTGRLCWTNDLHQVFLQAVETLGPTATPTAIQKQMNVEGLSRQQVSSHWQHFRKRGYPQQSTSASQSNNNNNSLEFKDKIANRNAASTCNPENSLPQYDTYPPPSGSSVINVTEQSSFWHSSPSSESWNSLSSSTDSSPSSCDAEQHNSPTFQVYSSTCSSSPSSSPYGYPQQQQQQQQHYNQLYTEPGFYSQDFSHSIEVSFIPESEELLKCSLEDTEMTFSDPQLRRSFVYSVCGSSWNYSQSTFCPVETSFYYQS